MTRATRRAANAAAGSVVVFAVLFLVTTQIDAVRAVSPFADDPWDAIASYAALFLPVVVGATWIRSVRHRGPVLPDAVARRIRWGAGLAAGIVAVASVADLVAIAVVGLEPGAAERGLLIGVLVALATCSGVIALGMTIASVRVAAATGLSPVRVDAEPDVVDDLLALAVDIAGPFGLAGPARRLGAGLELFLDGSRLSPRRHRRSFGLVVATAAAIGFDAWHTIREGPPASAWVLVVFGVLTGSGVLALYLGTVEPLRLLRPTNAR